MNLPRRILVVTLLACLVPLSGTARAQEKTPAGDRFADRPLQDETRGAATGEAAPAVGPSLTRIGGSLLLVAGLVVGLGLAYRRMFAASAQKAGGGVTLVSRQLLTPKHQVFILRTGHRLLVVGDSGHGMNLLTEITDPAEVTMVLGEAGDTALKGEVFAASLDSATEGFGEDEYIPAEPEMASGEADGGELGLGAAREEVQSLIERVRRLAGQGTTSEDGARQAS